ncbi:IS66-like element accessory protein TnpA [Sinorhizobium meliloti]|uniref:IS66-like element accessory protein TnpA n=1 Tax=Rhizobium meliloti TaxID=382 RepID=UPI000312FFB1|nr:transposase [Sinorhizobium meliloti]MDE4601642.1 transposase [Sinorhizobium meliloti]QQF03144.1 transposase [Sinorhizobium meliloti]UDU18019.1 transposase [Sinorhizobium meliloti]
MGRIEILTGVERRRVWTDGEKLRILDEVETSGSGVAEIARRHDILPQQIYTWRKKLGRDNRPADRSGVRLLPVALIGPDADDETDRTAAAERAAPKRSVKPSRIEIGCRGGRVLKVDASIAPEKLKALIRSVEEA